MTPEECRTVTGKDGTGRWKGTGGPNGECQEQQPEGSQSGGMVRPGAPRGVLPGSVSTESQSG